MRLYTIGYEGLNLPAFLAALQEHSIQTVVDVRATPVSRKPGFSKSKLQGFLMESDISYSHFQSLGCPRQIRDAYKNDGDWKHYCQLFNLHLASQQGSLLELSRLADESRCALMCFEADHQACHRSLIAEALKHESSLAVGHI
jgi:uncharacterized protein (DUF488 family)